MNDELSWQIRPASFSLGTTAPSLRTVIRKDEEDVAARERKKYSTCRLVTRAKTVLYAEARYVDKGRRLSHYLRLVTLTSDERPAQHCSGVHLVNHTHK